MIGAWSGLFHRVTSLEDTASADTAANKQQNRAQCSRSCIIACSISHWHRLRRYLRYVQVDHHLTSRFAIARSILGKTNRIIVFIMEFSHIFDLPG